MAKSKEAPVLLTPREAARRIGIAVETLTLWVKEERNLPKSACVVLPSGHRRYREDAIERFVKGLPEEGEA